MDFEPNNTEDEAEDRGILSVVLPGGSVNDIVNGSVALISLTGPADSADVFQYTISPGLQKIDLDLSIIGTFDFAALGEAGVNGLSQDISIYGSGGFVGAILVRGEVGLRAYFEEYYPLLEALGELRSRIFAELLADEQDGIIDAAMQSDFNRVSELRMLLESLREESGSNVDSDALADRISSDLSSYTQGADFVDEIKALLEAAEQLARDWAVPVFSEYDLEAGQWVEKDIFFSPNYGLDVILGSETGYINLFGGTSLSAAVVYSGDSFRPVEYAFSVYVDSEFSNYETGGDQEDSITGGDSDDVIFGRAGDDYLYGGIGDDALYGGLGNDTLSGGVGDDTLEGGDGTDWFVINPGEERVTILDFELGADILDLRGFGRSDVLAALGAATAGDAVFTFGDGTVVTVEGNGVTPETLSLENVVIAPENSPSTGSVVISGNAEEDQVLTADASGVSDADGIDAATASFQWQRDGVDIPGALSSTYVLSQVDVGTAVGVVYSYTDGFGTDESVTSAATAVVANVNDPPAGAVTISGTAAEGETLTAANTLTDADGLGTIAYQWQRGGTDIAGATGASYILTQADVGAAITVTASYTDGLGTEESVTSDPTAAVANVNDPPEGMVTIIGTAVEDETLTAANTLSDADGLDAGTVALQWQRDGVDVAGATGSTYTLTQDDVGAAITVVYSYTDLLGTPESVTSAPTDPVENVQDLIVGVMSISGDPFPGSTLTSDDSNVTDPDGVASREFYWARDGAFIPGATTNTYTVTEADRGKRIFAGVKITDAFGDVAFRSGANVLINAAPTGSPEITGVAEQGSTVGVSLAQMNDPEGRTQGTETYRWQRDGVDVPGATGATYTLTADDVGSLISVTVSYSDGAGYTETVRSAATAPVIAAGQIITGTPGPDDLPGTAGSDMILALGGDDRLTGGAGNDTLDGGSGTDTGVYGGDQSSYTLQIGPNAMIITDRRPGGDGTDTLIDMEFLDFASGTFDPFDLGMFAGPAGLSPDDFESFIELYIAYFNRAPDAIGLNFWGTAFATGTTLGEIATLFAGQSETLATYPPGTTNLQFATTVYNNVLGRTPDQAGLDFWVGQLDVGNVSRDQFILEVLGGVQPGSPDRAYLDLKVDIGAYFAVHKGMSDVDNASAAMALYDGTPAGTDAAIAAIDAYHANALDPDTGEFLMPVVGVLEEVFGVA